MKSLRVLRSLGGCGGTLVTRVLSALQGVVVLGECNPRSANLFGGALNPLHQIQQWYPDLTPAGFQQHEIGYPPFFGAFLQALDEKITQHASKLIIRDYSYADVIGVPFTTEPYLDLSLDLAVGANVQIIDALLVRHPADQLASLRKHATVARVLTPCRLLEGYVRLFAARPDIALVRYESLFEAPDKWFQDLCGRLDVDFTETSLYDLSSSARVTGNLTRINEPMVRLPRSREGDKAQAELVAEKNYASVMNQLGYHT